MLITFLYSQAANHQQTMQIELGIERRPLNQVQNSRPAYITHQNQQNQQNQQQNIQKQQLSNAPRVRPRSPHVPPQGRMLPGPDVVDLRKTRKSSTRVRFALDSGWSVERAACEFKTRDGYTNSYEAIMLTKKIAGGRKNLTLNLHIKAIPSLYKALRTLVEAEEKSCPLVDDILDESTSAMTRTMKSLNRTNDGYYLLSNYIRHRYPHTIFKLESNYVMQVAECTGSATKSGGYEALLIRREITKQTKGKKKLAQVSADISVGSAADFERNNTTDEVNAEAQEEHKPFTFYIPLRLITPLYMAISIIHRMENRGSSTDPLSESSTSDKATSTDDLDSFGSVARVQDQDPEGTKGVSANTKEPVLHDAATGPNQYYNHSQDEDFEEAAPQSSNEVNRSKMSRWQNVTDLGSVNNRESQQNYHRQQKDFSHNQRSADHPRGPNPSAKRSRGSLYQHREEDYVPEYSQLGSRGHSGADLVKHNNHVMRY